MYKQKHCPFIIFYSLQRNDNTLETPAGSSFHGRIVATNEAALREKKKNKQLRSFTLPFNPPQAVHHLIAQTAASSQPV